MAKVNEDILRMYDGNVFEIDSIAERVANNLIFNPEKIAYIQGNRKVTWKESVERTYCICQAFKRLGVRKGDRIALLAHNSIEYSEIMIATLLIGACIVPLATSIAAENIISMLKDSAAKVLIASRGGAEKLTPFVDDLTMLVDGGKLTIDGPIPQWNNFLDYLEIKDEVVPNVEIEKGDDFNIIYSSGTTGSPKGILYKHYSRNIVANSLFVDLEVVNLIATPLYSNMTTITWYSTIYNGGTTVIMDKFDEKEALHLIEKNQVTVAMFVPVQYERMLKVDRFNQYDLSSMQRKYSTSSLLKVSIKKELISRFPGILIEFYGLTEGGAGTILIADLYPTKLSSVGKVGPGQELKIIDEQEFEVEPGDIGEIVGHSPIMSEGYINNEILNSDMHWFDTTGKLFYKSGDIGKLDDDGFLYILDRKKDIIISGGVNIYASDLELTLLEHPGVSEAAVIAAQSKAWGETPVAFVIKHNKVDITEETLRRWVNDRLAKHQSIKKVFFRDDLPRSDTGKLLKRKLRYEYDQIFNLSL